MLNSIKIFIIVAFLLFVTVFHINAVEKAKEQVRQEYILLMKEQERKQLELQGTIVLEALQLEQEKNEQITRLNARTNELLSSLSHRPTRPSETPIVTETSPSCTGEVLYREDGEFLTREAARADRVLAERNYYYEQYEQVRKQINEFNQSH
jgi:hypothetical protein